MKQKQKEAVGMSSSGELIETLGDFIRAGITKSEDHLITVGVRLCEAHERIKSGQEKISWLDFLAGHCGLSLSRAHELMRAAGGKTTLEETRKRAREGMAAHRAKVKAKEAVRNVTQKPKQSGLAVALAAYDALDPADQTKFWEARGLQAVASKPEADPAAAERIRELERENEELKAQLKVFKSPVRCEFVEDDGGRATAGYKEASGDCVARAITIATGKPYAEVFEELKARYAKYVKHLHKDHYERRRRKEAVEHGCSEKVSSPYLEFTRLEVHAADRAYLSTRWCSSVWTPDREFGSSLRRPHRRRDPRYL